MEIYEDLKKIVEITEGKWTNIPGFGYVSFKSGFPAFHNQPSNILNKSFTKEEFYKAVDKMKGDSDSRDFCQLKKSAEVMSGLCKKARMCVTLNQEGTYQVYDIDTESGTEVKHVQDVFDILNTKVDYVDKMNRYKWVE